jgi:hypothetical protein
MPRGKNGESSKFCSAIEDDPRFGRVFRDSMDVSCDLLLDRRSDERDPCPSEAEGNLHQMDRINVALCHPADEGR